MPNDLPIVGKEYEYLGQPVKITRVVPSTCEGCDHYVEFVTRFCEHGNTYAGELGPWGLRGIDISEEEWRDA